MFLSPAPLHQVRACRDAQAVESSLAEVESAARGTGNLLAAAVVAARARATLGEISSAMEKVITSIFSSVCKFYLLLGGYL